MFVSVLCLYFFLDTLGTFFANHKKSISKAGIFNRFILETSLVFPFELCFVFISGSSVQ